MFMKNICINDWRRNVPTKTLYISNIINKIILVYCDNLQYYLF